MFSQISCHGGYEKRGIDNKFQQPNPFLQRFQMSVFSVMRKLHVFSRVNYVLFFPVIIH